MSSVQQFWEQTLAMAVLMAAVKEPRCTPSIRVPAMKEVSHNPIPTRRRHDVSSANPADASMEWSAKNSLRAL
jgi:hypothetical protein